MYISTRDLIALLITIILIVEGYNKNSTDVEKLTVKETVEKGRKLCRYED